MGYQRRVHGIQTYLKGAKSPGDALAKIDEGLPSLEKAIAARERPKPPPKEEPKEWVYTWLKSKKMESLAGPLMGQALETRDDILEAPLDHKALDDMGIKKIGERCKLLRYIEEEREKSVKENGKSDKVNK